MDDQRRLDQRRGVNDARSVVTRLRAGTLAQGRARAAAVAGESAAAEALGMQTPGLPSTWSDAAEWVMRLGAVDLRLVGRSLAAMYEYAINTSNALEVRRDLGSVHHVVVSHLGAFGGTTRMALEGARQQAHVVASAHSLHGVPSVSELLGVSLETLLDGVEVAPDAVLGLAGFVLCEVCLSLLTVGSLELIRPGVSDFVHVASRAGTEADRAVRAAADKVIAWALTEGGDGL